MIRLPSFFFIKIFIFCNICPFRFVLFFKEQNFSERILYYEKMDRIIFNSFNALFDSL